jgi:uncharacterized Tic20 family protein
MIPTPAGREIAPEERTLAAWAHLSGLAGYVIPLGGVLVPVIVMLAKKESPVISSIARQAVILNLVVWGATAVSAVLLLTILLIPAVILLWVALVLAAVALPIVGAIRAWDGIYFKYPLVGTLPR